MKNVRSSLNYDLSLPHSLRPCWTNVFSILRGRVLLSQTCNPLDFRWTGIGFRSLLAIDVIGWFVVPSGGRYDSPLFDVCS